MKEYKSLIFCCFLLVINCDSSARKAKADKGSAIRENKTLNQYITVLGIAQDAGYPQINCSKTCCKPYFNKTESNKLVSCLGLVDKVDNKKWLFDATPDIVEQTSILSQKHLNNGRVIDGIFLTHAHMGHYTGLMQLGREALGADNIPVFAMPRMKSFLENNGPWNQLLELNNINLNSIKSDSVLMLNKSIKVNPFLVPHRDEYSETVGYKIEGKNNQHFLYQILINGKHGRDQ